MGEIQKNLINAKVTPKQIETQLIHPVLKVKLLPGDEIKTLIKCADKTIK